VVGINKVYAQERLTPLASYDMMDIREIMVHSAAEQWVQVAIRNALLIAEEKDLELSSEDVTELTAMARSCLTQDVLDRIFLLLSVFDDDYGIDMRVDASYDVTRWELDKACIAIYGSTDDNTIHDIGEQPIEET